MKRFQLILTMTVLILSAAMADGSASNSYETLFQQDNIIDIQITVSEEDWQAILDDPTAQEYKSATVSVNGTTLSNVGFRTKGNLTLNSVASIDSDRYSFRIKFDKYVEGQSLLGLDELVVNNMFSDPSYLREYLSYEALRSIGSPAPLATFANISINGELFGFYLCAEAVDDAFLQRNFGSNSGNLYKQESPSSMLYDADSSYPNSELKKGDDTDKSSLKNMLKILNETPDGEKGSIESVLDVDSALQYIAANTMLGNYDSYNGDRLQNYFLYEQGGQFHVIPWDYNMSFGGYMGSFTAGQTIPIDEPVFRVSMEQTPLITKLLSVPEYQETYYGYIRQLLTYMNTLEERISSLADLIRPYVEQDPTKFITMEDFETNIAYDETANTNDFDTMGGMAPPDGMAMPTDHPGFPSDQAQSPSDQLGQPPADIPNAFHDRQGLDGRTPSDAELGPGGAFPDRQFGDAGGGVPGGHGGGMMTKSASIVTFIRGRAENVAAQLAGELPTTGNTTINQGAINSWPQHTPAAGIHLTIGQTTAIKNGERVSLTAPALLQNDRTLVPLHSISNLLGYDVSWDGESNTVTIHSTPEIKLTIGDAVLYKGEESISLDVPAVLINDSTMVPLRAISEALDCRVEWDETTNTVSIYPTA